MATPEVPISNVERPMSSFERATIRWAKAAVIMAALAAIFVCLQWWEMREGGKDTHDLAVAAKTQAERITNMSTAADQIRQATQDTVAQEKRIADNARDSLAASNRANGATLQATINQFRQEQRAWVGVQDVNPVGGFTEKEPWQATVVFFNSGRTPARHVETSGMFLTSPFPIHEPPQEDIKQLTFRPAPSIAPQSYYRQAFGLPVGAEPPMTFQLEGQQTLISQYPLIKSGRLFLYYFGILRYKDNAGVQRDTHFCVLLQNVQTKQGGFCDGFNDLN